MAAKSNSKMPPSLQCLRCRGVMEPLYIILDPTSGKHCRAFRCDCGERTLRYENLERSTGLSPT
jgi:hypothetical protein